MNTAFVEQEYDEDADPVPDLDLENGLVRLFFNSHLPYKYIYTTVNGIHDAVRQYARDYHQHEAQHITEVESHETWASDGTVCHHFAIDSNVLPSGRAPIFWCEVQLQIPGVTPSRPLNVFYE
jgi:hypothetical protein